MWHMYLIIGIKVVQIVAGPRVLSTTDEGFALALSEAGNVYSWGKAAKGASSDYYCILAGC